MVKVLKKDKNSSKNKLVSQLGKLIYLLEGQKEDEAAEDLRTAQHTVETHLPVSEEFQKALSDIKEAFDGEHELRAYTFATDKATEWSEADELYLASTSVLNLVSRLTQK